MKKLIAMIFMFIIASNSYYGIVNEKGENVTDIQEVLEQQNLVTNDIVEEQEKTELSEVQNAIEIPKTTEVEKTLEQKEVPEITQANVKKNNTQSNIKEQEKKPKPVETKPTPTQVKQETKESNTTEKVKANTNTNKSESTNNTIKCTHPKEDWYDSEAEAIAVYNKEIKKWGNKWTNYEIDSETYYKNCPSGYETFDCAYCKKWTIILYH